MQFIEVTDTRAVYDYLVKYKDTVPYWFDTEYELWEKCFNTDTDYDGEEMFEDTKVYAACSGTRIAGFVQCGISRYIYNENGEKDYNIKCGVIRNLLFERVWDCGDGLIEAAEKYFDENGVNRRSAFFHAFGMSCYAGHGKLYCGLPWIETVLVKNGYVREHENVYYKKILKAELLKSDRTVSVKYGETTAKGLCEFGVFDGEKNVGAGALVYLPQGKICYLKWIYIYDSEQGKGYGSAALERIFCDLYAQGIERFDTDTADSNVIAQRLYNKVGFKDMGRTRSFLKQEA